MKTLFNTCIATTVIIAALNGGHDRKSDTTREIEKTIQHYLTAMSVRDVEGLRTVLDTRFTAIEAADKNAKVYFVDTANSKELLPPKGNNNWDKDKVRLSSLKAEVSATHSSVATASFTLTFPLTKKRMADLKAALKQTPAVYDESQRKTVAKAIAAGAIHNSMFAMLARQDGKWKIVCMSFPK